MKFILLSTHTEILCKSKFLCEFLDEIWIKSPTDEQELICVWFFCFFLFGLFQQENLRLCVCFTYFAWKKCELPNA